MSTLPPGLTHPYDTTRARREVFRHGHTFTWTLGDSYVAVQRGRVANASRATVLADQHPEHPPLTGRQPVVDWLVAPARGEWHRHRIMTLLADQWLRIQRATPREPA
ncbi:hypothetical protein H0B56_22390 [Haloechinothrix sp. YIM 98757]|uniref:Uncharacterized protein n=1 Tax=Haloechinothrix aidingensis TaxID=2752311 RepID=A0A838AFY3_9PSEU|nr:hypothetical protein [Haloechinothrix aidingensis]MBA0128304.1 hypothetical protein [Haloechinothrix aidingensis]